MPAEMRRIAVLSLEPDPGNAGVGMRYTVSFNRIATPHGSPCGIFFALDLCAVGLSRKGNENEKTSDQSPL